MRSHAVVLGGLVTVLVVLAVGHWQRQRAIQTAHTPAARTTANPTQTITTPAITWPGVSETSSTRASMNPQADLSGRATVAIANREGAAAAATVGGMAVIAAQDPDAEVNVRSLPSSNADSLGYGLVGDTVILERSETAEDGHTWHYVTFQDAPTTGWIRSDFLDIVPATVDAAADLAASSASGPDVLQEALDEHCGGPKTINAYYMTQSHLIYLCKRRGRLLYLSQEKGTEQIIVSKNAQPVGGGYIMVNDNYEYRLDSSQFVVIRIDEKDKENEVLRESVLYSERY